MNYELKLCVIVKLNGLKFAIRIIETKRTEQTQNKSLIKSYRKLESTHTHNWQ